MIDDWCATNPKFNVTHVLSHEEKDVDQHYKKGFIDRALIESVVPPASEGDDVLIFICGPPVMYDILCGPRDDKNITGVLEEMGYSQHQVYKFQFEGVMVQWDELDVFHEIEWFQVERFRAQKLSLMKCQPMLYWSRTSAKCFAIMSISI